jgi:cyclic-di-GMP-binding protein
MTEPYKQLGDQLPERSSAVAGSFPSDPKAVARWVEELPRANPQVTLARLADAFAQLRVRALPPGHRIAVLDVLRPVAMESIQFLDRQLQTSTFPLSPAASQAAESCLNLHRELALGYRAGVHEALTPAGSVSFLRRGAVAQMLVRGSLHHVRLLSLCYFLYRMPLPGAWFGLHSLYRFARASGLAQKAVDEPADGGARSVEQLYLQSVLLALSNPFRFSQREQQELWPISRELVGELELTDAASGESAFALPVATDRGPGYIPEEREAGADVLLWLDLASLRAVLEQPLLAAGVEHVSLKLRRQRRIVTAPAELLRRLRAGWGTAAERRARRLGATHALDTVIRLSGLHYFLAGESDFDSFMHQVTGHRSGAAPHAAWAHATQETVKASRVRAQVLDQSLGGYRLLWPRETGIRIRVGELLGLTIAHEEDDPLWMVGVVRWMRYHGDGSVDAGIELLSRRAHAVGLRTLDLLGTPKAAQRGIAIDWLRGDHAEARYFLASSLIDSNAGKVEIAGLQAAEDDLDGRSGSETVLFGQLSAVEQAGDYVLLRAVRLDAQAPTEV